MIQIKCPYCDLKFDDRGDILEHYLFWHKMKLSDVQILKVLKISPEPAERS